MLPQISSPPQACGGYIAGDWGVSWTMFRDKADGLQRSQTGNPIEVEGQTTQLAERIGYDLGMKAWSKMVTGKE